MLPEVLGIRRIVDRVRFYRVGQNSFHRVFRDFDEAARNAPTHLPKGYDIPDTAGFYRERLEHVHHDDYATLFWFEKALQDGRTILEIGGHVGVAYYSFQRLVKYPDDLRWTILDVPSVIEAGRVLAQERGQGSLHFISDWAAAPTAEILIASGSLQYLPLPLLPERVRNLTVWPRHILINMTPVTKKAGYVTLQNLGVSFCPYRIHSYAELIEPLLRMGYELVDSWQKERRVVVPGYPDCTVDHYSGYYLRRPA